MHRSLFVPAAMAVLVWASLSGAALAGAALAAQQGGTPGGSSTSPAAVPVPASSADDSSASADMKPVKTELQGKLDAKSAKSGDPIVVKTTESVKIAPGAEIPRGSKLVGHVVKVQPATKESPNSAIAVTFDQARLKDGQTLPIHSMIQSVDPPGGMQQTGATDMMAGPAGPSAGSPGGTASAAGSRTSSGTAASAPGTPMPAADPGQNGQSNGPVAGKVVAGSGPNAIRTTDIPNIFLASNAAGPASGVLYAAKTNVHLDGGTQMVVEIASTGSH